ncbi:MAG: hypothetical protein SGJ18_04250 [Pseudomonadota bacterium]|nr:hypothetical protein [Pseudomonadota bacterium]
MKKYTLAILILAMLASSTQVLAVGQKFELTVIKSDNANWFSKQIEIMNSSEKDGPEKIQREIIENKNECVAGISEFAKDEKARQLTDFFTQIKAKFIYESTAHPHHPIVSGNEIKLTLEMVGLKTRYNENNTVLIVDIILWQLSKKPTREYCKQQAKILFDKQKDFFLTDVENIKKANTDVDGAFGGDGTHNHGADGGGSHDHGAH